MLSSRLILIGTMAAPTRCSGPSGCGKSTLLEHHLRPADAVRGAVLFDGEGCHRPDTDKRNIAQVFQFPVIYDTMSVYDNLAFPLRNRALTRNGGSRVSTKSPEMLELEDMLARRRPVSRQQTEALNGPWPGP